MNKKQRGLPARASLRHLQSGQTLLEILVALGASILILSAIAVIVITSLSGTLFTKNQNLANQYAQEGIEVVRRIRDSGWDNFSSLTATHYCLPQSQTVLTAAPSCVQNVGIFVREIEIEHFSADCPVPTSPPSSPPMPKGSKVTSITSWTDGKCPIGNIYCHRVELVTCLHNVNQVEPL